jgi:replicative DNA helicase
LNIPIIALSQLNRAVDSRPNKRPILSDLRDSGSIEQDADLVAFLYRHEYYDKTDLASHGKAEVNIAKARNGPTGTFDLAFRKQIAKFENLAHTERTPPQFYEDPQDI